MPTDPRTEDPDRWAETDFVHLTPEERDRMLPVRETREPLDFDPTDRDRPGWWPDLD